MTTIIPERIPLGTSTLNRDWYLDVDTASSSTASTWVGVFGITNFQNAVAANMADDGDFDSGGWDSSTKTSQGWTVTATVARKLQLGVDPAAYDPGQEFIRAAADQYGEDGTVHIRWYKNDDAKTEAYEGWASVQWAPQGGDRNALDTVQITLAGQGKRTSITFPSATAPAAWAATTAYAFNDEVTLTGGAVLRCTAAGTSDASEPTAPAVNGTVVDGTVTWLRLS